MVVKNHGVIIIQKNHVLDLHIVLKTSVSDFNGQCDVTIRSRWVVVGGDLEGDIVDDFIRKNRFTVGILFKGGRATLSNAHHGGGGRILNREGNG